MQILLIGDIVWLALIAALGPISAIIGAIITTLINSHYAKKNTEAIDKQTEVVTEIGEVTKEGAKEVKSVLLLSKDEVAKELKTHVEKIDKLAKVSLATHTFVNSGEGRKLDRMASKSRQIAELLPTTENLEEARLDEEESQMHKIAQKVVNGQVGTDAEKQGK